MKDELELLKNSNLKGLSDEEKEFCHDVDLMLAQVPILTPPEEIDNRILLVANANVERNSFVLRKWLALAASLILVTTLISIFANSSDSNSTKSLAYKSFLQYINSKPSVLVENKRLNQSIEKLDDSLLEFEEELFLLALEVDIN